MKILLACLTFYLVLNFISASDTVNAQQANNASNTYHPASHLHELIYQEQAHSHNAPIVQQQADTINNENNRVVLQKHPQHQNEKYQPQDHLQNTTIVQSEMNPVIDDRVVHPKFRPWFHTHMENIQLNQPHLADERTVVNTTQSSDLLQNVPPKPQTREHLSFADFFQRPFRAFFEHQHEQFPSPTRSNIKTGLR